MARAAAWLGLSGAVVAIDQLSKSWVRSELTGGESVTVTAFFDLVLVYNAGAAFSFLSSASGWQRWFFVALAGAISVWLIVLIRRHAAERWMPLGLSLILGGALGNLIDRLSHGAVVDFLYFHAGRYGWPAFNAADSAITLGVALLAWEQFRPASTDVASRPGHRDNRGKV
jgi:signal peptidase II